MVAGAAEDGVLAAPEVVLDDELLSHDAANSDTAAAALQNRSLDLER